MGVVWAAEHLALGREVAIKFIRKERLATDPALLTRFEREARTLARITHPNVVRVMDSGSEESTPYIVMELLQGYSLADLFERGGRLSLGSVHALVRQVAGALAAAHDEGIVHRDIKPQNIFFTGTDPLCFKVLDFGVAKLLRLPSAASSTELTETGIVIGSAPYMSPEQLEAKGDVDPRSDLWSLGVIVYEALTGVRPFSGGSFVAVGAAVLNGQYQPASRHRAALPPTVERWLAKVLSSDVQRRFQSARELADAYPEPNEVASVTDGTVKPSLHDSQPRSVAPEPLQASAVTTVDHVPAVSNPHAARRKWSMSRAALGSTVALGLLGVFGFNSRSLFATAASCPAGMQLIPRARFEMGSQANADTPDDETTPGSANVVAVDAFCIDRTEVTVKDYARCKSCGPAKRTVEFEGLTPNGRAFDSQFCNGDQAADHPMNCVDWQEANGYCTALGKRLPTESEWELAARGTTSRTYPWGNMPASGERLNLCGAECQSVLDQLKRSGASARPDQIDSAATTPVGSFPSGATPEGVLDLAGNVWEWTASSYCPYPFQAKSDCGDSRRVLRGGGWDTLEITDVRAGRRYPAAPNARGKGVGFRCVEDL
jgi:serine/threonine protein kinase